MTKNVQHELRIDIVDRATGKGFAKYSNFSVGEPPRYTLHVSGYSGTAGDTNNLRRVVQSLKI